MPHSMHSLRAGIRCVVLTDGERAVYAADGSSVWKVIPPSITSVNPTGSGDSMLAGMLFGIEQGWDMPAQLAFGALPGQRMQLCARYRVDPRSHRWFAPDGCSARELHNNN